MRQRPFAAPARRRSPSRCRHGCDLQFPGPTEPVGKPSLWPRLPPTCSLRTHFPRVERHPPSGRDPPAARASVGRGWQAALPPSPRAASARTPRTSGARCGWPLPEPEPNRAPAVLRTQPPALRARRPRQQQQHLLSRARKRAQERQTQGRIQGSCFATQRYLETGSHGMCGSGPAPCAVGLQCERRQRARCRPSLSLQQPPPPQLPAKPGAVRETRHTRASRGGWVVGGVGAPAGQMLRAGSCPLACHGRRRARHRCSHLVIIVAVITHSAYHRGGGGAPTSPPRRPANARAAFKLGCGRDGASGPSGCTRGEPQQPYNRSAG